MVLKNEKGQTLVEYILLLAVVVSLVITFMRSDIFRKLFGEQGQIGAKIKEESEFAYRHAYSRNRPPGPPPIEYNMSVHPSYHEPGKGTRFFGPKVAYP